MAKQLNLLKTGQIIPTALHVEMERSYLEYAMSVIVGRALPDVRDGLKPVHRRILYAMYELGLTPDRPYRKCARVVGDVLGKYHPHGDQAVYEALVRLVQDFSSRYPLLAGHGNFGSVDNDPAAAMRYTETRLSPLAAQAVLRDIRETIVDFTNNFDNSQQEPVVLPAQLPILLLNGCSGIAVGMATNIPPHNLNEVVDGLIALIDQPQLEDEQLWQLIPAPDFPTGGEIMDLSGVREAYRTGKGIIPLRGVTKLERLVIGKRQNREKLAIVVTELPYQVNKSAWIEKVAELVNQGRLEGIADIRDESDRSGIRVVIELKKDTDPAGILEQLYHLTPLQINFGVIMLALVDNQPRQLSLRQLLEEFLRFREQTLTKQYGDELTQSQARLQLLEGLLAAINHLDEVIEILRQAADGTTARALLQQQLDLTESQADGILAMPLRRLTALETQKLQNEAAELQKKIAELEKLLQERHELLKALKKELRGLKRQFGDERRTRLLTEPKPTKEAIKETLTSSTNNFITVTATGYIYGQEQKSQSNQQELIIYQGNPPSESPLLLITDAGKVYPVAKEAIPPQSQKQLLWDFLTPAAQRDAQKIVEQFFTSDNPDGLDLLLLTAQGRGKRLVWSELEELGNRGLVLIKLKDADRLNHVCLVSEEQQVAIATTGGRIMLLRVNQQNFPTLGRNTQGNNIVTLRPREAIVNCVVVEHQKDKDIFLISELGYGKRLSLSTLRPCLPGELGSHGLRFSQSQDKLAAMGIVKGQKLVCITNTNQLHYLDFNRIPQLSRDSQGEQLIKLKGGQKIVTALTVL